MKENDEKYWQICWFNIITWKDVHVVTEIILKIKKFVIYVDYTLQLGSSGHMVYW